MKPLTFTSLFVISLLSVQAYTWIPLGPDSINADRCRFGIAMGQHVIIASGNMYMYEDDMQWHMYSFSLPINDAAYQNPTELLVVVGDGSYSDGIYTFNLETHNFELVDWLVNPNFIEVIPVLKKGQEVFTDQYFVGGQFSGLTTSADGVNWTAIQFFTGKSCTEIDHFNEHIVIAEVSNLNNIYCSDDYGVTWTASAPGGPPITRMRFNNEGELYGIFPSYSNSSGLYKSPDYGMTWTLEFYSDNLSAVGFDAIGNVFVGWESPTSTNEGIALYDPAVPAPGLTFLNAGLPNLNINRIMLNPTMSAIAIFACTDSGVYFCHDYLLGVEEKYAEEEITMYPNPAHKGDLVTIHQNSLRTIDRIEIYSANGMLIYDSFTETDKTGDYRLQTDNLDIGIYYCVYKTRGGSQTSRLLIY